MAGRHNSCRVEDEEEDRTWYLDRELAAADITWLQLKTLVSNRIRLRDCVDALFASIAYAIQVNK